MSHYKRLPSTDFQQENVPLASFGVMQNLFGLAKTIDQLTSPWMTQVAAAATLLPGARDISKVHPGAVLIAQRIRPIGPGVTRVTSGSGSVWERPSGKLRVGDGKTHGKRENPRKPPFFYRTIRCKWIGHHHFGCKKQLFLWPFSI